MLGNMVWMLLAACKQHCVKLQYTLVQAIMSFDLGCPVGDVAWAPFSSTVFAAATEDGKVRVYDVATNISEPLCEQLVVRAASLTRLAFNPRHPVLLVGDNKYALLQLGCTPQL